MIAKALWNSHRVRSVRRARLPASTAALVACLTLAPSCANAADFASELGAVGQACLSASSATCLDLFHGSLDANGDNRVEFSEAQGFHRELKAWVVGNEDALAPQDRQIVLATLLIVELRGLEGLFDAYDSDGDGGLTAGEIAADLRIDERPLPALLADPDAIDWPGVRRRLGPAALLLNDLLPH